MKAKCILNQELELISQPVSRSHSLTNWLHHCWTALIQALTDNLQPCVRKTIAASGEQRWYIYDPFNGKTAYLNSEVEVREWLDQRYHSVRNE
jgi:hypothetical protein